MSEDNHYTKRCIELVEDNAGLNKQITDLKKQNELKDKEISDLKSELYKIEPQKFNDFPLDEGEIWCKCGDKLKIEKSDDGVYYTHCIGCGHIIEFNITEDE